MRGGGILVRVTSLGPTQTAGDKTPLITSYPALNTTLMALEFVYLCSSLPCPTTHVRHGIAR